MGNLLQSDPKLALLLISAEMQKRIYGNGGHLFDGTSEDTLLFEITPNYTNNLNNFTEEAQRNLKGSKGDKALAELNAFLQKRIDLTAWQNYANDYITRLVKEHPELSKELVAEAFRKIPVGAAIDTGFNSGLAYETDSEHPNGSILIKSGYDIKNGLPIQLGGLPIDVNETMRHEFSHGVRLNTLGRFGATTENEYNTILEAYPMNVNFADKIAENSSIRGEIIKKTGLTGEALNDYIRHMSNYEALDIIKKHNEGPSYLKEIGRNGWESLYDDSKEPQSAYEANGYTPTEAFLNYSINGVPYKTILDTRLKLRDMYDLMLDSSIDDNGRVTNMTNYRKASAVLDDEERLEAELEKYLKQNKIVDFSRLGDYEGSLKDYYKAMFEGSSKQKKIPEELLKKAVEALKKAWIEVAQKDSPTPTEHMAATGGHLFDGETENTSYMNVDIPALEAMSGVQHIPSHWDGSMLLDKTIFSEDNKEWTDFLDDKFKRTSMYNGRYSKDSEDIDLKLNIVEYLKATKNSKYTKKALALYEIDLQKRQEWNKRCGWKIPDQLEDTEIADLLGKLSNNKINWRVAEEWFKNKNSIPYTRNCVDHPDNRKEFLGKLRQSEIDDARNFVQSYLTSEGRKSRVKDIQDLEIDVFGLYGVNPEDIQLILNVGYDDTENAHYIADLLKETTENLHNYKYWKIPTLKNQGITFDPANTALDGIAAHEYGHNVLFNMMALANNDENNPNRKSTNLMIDDWALPEEHREILKSRKKDGIDFKKIIKNYNSEIDRMKKDLEIAKSYSGEDKQAELQKEIDKLKQFKDLSDEEKVKIIKEQADRTWTNHDSEEGEGYADFISALYRLNKAGIYDARKVDENGNFVRMTDDMYELYAKSPASKNDRLFRMMSKEQYLKAINTLAANDTPLNQDDYQYAANGGKLSLSELEKQRIHNSKYTHQPLDVLYAEGGNMLNPDVLLRAAIINSNYEDAKDFNMGLLNYRLRRLFNKGLSNCTLNATQWIDPEYILKSAATIVEKDNPRYTQISEEEALPGDLLIARNPEKGNYHTMLIEGYDKNNKPLLRYSTGGDSQDSLRTGVTLQNYHDTDSKQGGNHTEDLYYRYTENLPTILPEVVVENQKKDGGSIRLEWSKLSMKDRAKVINNTIKNTLANGGSLTSISIDDIKHRYDEGGYTLPEVTVTSKYPSPELIKANIESLWPSARNLELYNIVPDTTFTRERTGAGSIEYMQGNGVNYGTELNPNFISNPYPGQSTIIFDPNSNTVDDVKLNLLHHYRATDPLYQELLALYLTAILDNPSTLDDIFWNSLLGDKFRALYPNKKYDWNKWRLLVKDNMNNEEFLIQGIDGTLRDLMAGETTRQNTNYLSKLNAEKQWLQDDKIKAAYLNIINYLLSSNQQLAQL